MAIAGSSHAKAIYEEYLANEEFCALVLVQALMKQFVEDENAAALFTLLNEIYGESELEIPVAFFYFNDENNRRELFITAFCDGLSKRLGELLYTIQEEDNEW